MLVYCTVDGRQIGPKRTLFDVYITVYIAGRAHTVQLQLSVASGLSGLSVSAKG